MKLKNMVWYVWIELGFATYCKYLWKFRSAGEYEKSILKGKFLSEAQNYYSFKITVKVSNSIDNNNCMVIFMKKKTKWNVYKIPKLDKKLMVSVSIHGLKNW